MADGDQRDYRMYSADVLSTYCMYQVLKELDGAAADKRSTVEDSFVTDVEEGQ